MKFSVVIPTLLRSPFFPKLLEDLNSCPFIDEIIIIDNSGGYEPKYMKEKVHSLGRNIYVNPAWNLGVALSKNENICICNDDGNFDPSIFEYMSTRIQGVIGMATDNYYGGGELRIEPIFERNWGWGCVIFVKKSEYKNIPNDLLIACGDDYLIKHIPAFILKGLNVTTQISTTSFNPEFFPIQDNDLRTFNTKYK